LRVISGSARGKKLLSPDGQDIRPTLDRVKESVFNMIAFSANDASVLDLFCGSGALGIEALSRGAREAVFVDADRKSIQITEKNLELTRLKPYATCVLSDSIAFLKTTDKQFDLIFLDPPYESFLYEKALNEIKVRNLLAPDGLLIVEFDKVLTPLFSHCGFSVQREKKYGRVKILIMKE